MAIAPERQSYRVSMVRVREALERSGGAESMSRRELEECRADLLIVRETAARMQAPGSPIASFFTLSDDLEALFIRLAADPDVLPEPHPKPARDRLSQRPGAVDAADGRTPRGEG